MISKFDIIIEKYVFDISLAFPTRVICLILERSTFYLRIIQ